VISSDTKVKLNIVLVVQQMFSACVPAPILPKVFLALNRRLILKQDCGGLWTGTRINIKNHEAVRFF